MGHEVRDSSIDYKRYRRMGTKLDAWALASEATVAKDIYASIASDGTRTFGDLMGSVHEGSLEGWNATWVGRLARIILLQPHENELHDFAFRALELAVDELPTTPATLMLRKLHLELLFSARKFDRAREMLSENGDLSSLYHGYLGTDLLNPYMRDDSETTDAWIKGLNVPFLDAGLSEITVDPTAQTPFDGLSPKISPGTVEGPLVSVIVTTFNPSPVEIRTAVRSILRQTWKNIEVLLVDDHSDEDKVRPLEELAAEDPRIRLLRLPVNGGTYRARNAGIREANGKYITGQDTDDWSHPERIAMQVAVLEGNEILPGVATAANRTDDLLVKMAPGHSPHRKCEVSLMLRVDDARAIGGYLPVRKAADSEFRERLEAWAGQPTQVIDHPLYMIRISYGSLSRMDFRPGWSHSARRAFWSSYKLWHRSASREELQIDASGDVAGIPSSAPERIAGREWAKDKRFDVCIVADWRGNTPQQRAARDELTALADTDLEVAVLHIDTPWGQGTEPRSLHPEVQRLISTGQVDRIFVDEQVDVDLMLVRAPETMDFARRTLSELRCGQTVLIGHGALAHRRTEVRDYDPANAHATARMMFGREPIWSLPEGDPADGVANRFGIPVGGETYPLYVDTGRYSGIRLRRPAGGPLVLGCVAINDTLAWPERDDLLAAFPFDGTEEVRVLGDARGAVREIEETRIPANWVQFRENETDSALFWRTVDAAVFLGRELEGPSIDRSVLEALATGTLVLAGMSSASKYQGAVVPISPEETVSMVRSVSEDSERMEKILRHSKQLIKNFSDPARVEGYVRKCLNNPLAGAIDDV